MNKPNYYAVIPANVRYSNITPNAKLLYGEITALCNERGYCWARNEYFANLYKVSKNSISNWIKELIDNNFVQSEILYKKGTKEVERRCLTIVNDPIQEILDTPPKDFGEGPQEILDTPPKDFGYPIQNNLEVNNTDNNTNNITNNNKGNSNKNSLQIIVKNNQNQTPKVPRVSAPAVSAGSQLPKRTKGKLIGFDAETKKVLINYCLFLIDSYSFKDTQLCNRIDEIVKKARGVPKAIEVICQYNINGGYGKLYIPGNLGKKVAEEVVVSQQATEEDFVRDENGNIEEIW